MARRNLENIDQKMIEAVIQLGAEIGAREVTATKVAQKCGISHFTCFEHFGTKKGMLDAAASYFDRKYMAVMKKLLDAGLSQQELFNAMLDNFLEDKDGAIFYNNYIMEYGFDPTTHNERAKEFLEYVKLLYRNAELTDDQMLIAWDYITSMAFYYAEKIIHGYIENTPDNRSFINLLVFNGIPN